MLLEGTEVMGKLAELKEKLVRSVEMFHVSPSVLVNTVC